eukprot:TRINITY_DN48995_c0_g1_i1.p1 TRINITY_DN48995_c0_g1~~TRINITY_DN48995_c0_g1_i1.p1  ORF type:complete len:121 (+),score=45.61 TRINITY_DN48995_c0_g1_i1:89-451(+)
MLRSLVGSEMCIRDRVEGEELDRVEGEELAAAAAWLDLKTQQHVVMDHEEEAVYNWLTHSCARNEAPHMNARNDSPDLRLHSAEMQSTTGVGATDGVEQHAAVVQIQNLQMLAELCAQSS